MRSACSQPWGQASGSLEAACGIARVNPTRFLETQSRMSAISGTIVEGHFGRQEECQRHFQRSDFQPRCRIEQHAISARGLHDLRHTYASRLLQNGESVVYVKEQLGHSSIQVTVDIYGHLVPGANRAAVNRLDQVCSPTDHTPPAATPAQLQPLKQSQGER